MGFFETGYSMVLVKNWQFFHRFIIDKIGQENVLVFPDYKNKKLELESGGDLTSFNKNNPSSCLLKKGKMKLWGMLIFLEYAIKL